MVSVLLSNGDLAVLRRADPFQDSHGAVVPGPLTRQSGYLPGAVREDASGGWSIRLDPAVWPVREGDIVVDRDGRRWLMTSAALIQNAATPEVDYVRVQAQEQTGGGTEPPGQRIVTQPPPLI